MLGATSDEADHIARHAGIAQGLVETVRRLPIDAARQEAFVPLDVLQRHGGTIAELYAGVDKPALRAARGEMLAAARTHRDQAMTLLGSIASTARPAFLPLAVLPGQCDRLGSDGMFAAPEPPSRLAVLWTLWRASKTTAFKTGSSSA